MGAQVLVEFKDIGRIMRLRDVTGPGTNGQRRYVVWLQDLKEQRTMQHTLSLSQLSALHAALTQELMQRRRELSRRSDGIFDPYR